MIATAPGKLILSGEYAVLDGAPALVIAVNRRAIAARRQGPAGSSPFLAAVADELGARGRRPAAEIAMSIAVDSKAFYDTPSAGLAPMKLGLGSSAAVTVAATALALGAGPGGELDRDLVLEIALAAHARAQVAIQHEGSPRSKRVTGDLGIPRSGSGIIPLPGSEPGAMAGSHATPSPSGRVARATPMPAMSSPTSGPSTRGSGADIAASVLGGAIAFQKPRGLPADGAPVITRLSLPSNVTLIPFFTGAAADTRQLVAQVLAARLTRPADVDAALAAIRAASQAAVAACARPLHLLGQNDNASTRDAFLAAMILAARAMDALATATQLPLVPPCVTVARVALGRLGGTAKTTGAGGGDIAIAILPSTEDATIATRSIIEAGGRPLALAVDHGGVDLRPDAQ